MMNPINTILVKMLPVFPRKFVRLFANKYIAGDKIEDAVRTVRLLNAKGIMTTVDVLGESIKNKEEARESMKESIEVVDTIVKEKLNGNLSVKLSMLGLGMDNDLCRGLFREILDFAKEKNIFVRIDMEDSAVTEETIRIYEEMRINYNIGLVLQAYMRRTDKDVVRLSEGKANFRLCKGIYVEPESVAFKNKQEIRDNYLKVLRLMFERGAYVGIATHDDFLTDVASDIIREMGLTNDKYEYQMLFGVREGLRDTLVKQGHRMRIYVPFGKRWYEYSIRRFKENPNVAGHVLKSIFIKG
ncbi:MAG: proline dehydrogenase family protein [Ignavibacteriae bacterium]|nr:proline dehydrogenase family protein [Ignavibacteriota bacterium]